MDQTRTLRLMIACVLALGASTLLPFWVVVDPTVDARIMYIAGLRDSIFVPTSLVRGAPFFGYLIIGLALWSFLLFHLGQKGRIWFPAVLSLLSTLSGALAVHLDQVWTGRETGRAFDPLADILGTAIESSSRAAWGFWVALAVSGAFVFISLGFGPETAWIVRPTRAFVAGVDRQARGLLRTVRNRKGAGPEVHVAAAAVDDDVPE